VNILDFLGQILNFVTSKKVKISIFKVKISNFLRQKMVALVIINYLMTGRIGFLLLAVLGEDRRQFDEEIGRIGQQFRRQLNAQFAGLGAVSVRVQSLGSREQNVHGVVQRTQFTEDSADAVGNCHYARRSGD